MTEENNDYTRVRFHAQRGDSPDNRGEVTVELSHSHDEHAPHFTRAQAEKELTEAVDHLETVLDL